MSKQSVQYAEDMVRTWEDHGMPIVAGALIERLEDDGYDDDDIAEAVRAVGLRYYRVYELVSSGPSHV